MQLSPFWTKIILPVNYFFTGTSGKNTFTGKSGLPEQRFTTLVLSRAYLSQEVAWIPPLDSVRLPVRVSRNFLERNMHFRYAATGMSECHGCWVAYKGIPHKASKKFRAFWQPLSGNFGHVSIILSKRNLDLGNFIFILGQKGATRFKISIMNSISGTELLSP